MEFKINILGWWNKRKAKKQSDEQAYREAQRPIYRGASMLRMKELDSHEQAIRTKKLLG